LVFVSLS